MEELIEKGPTSVSDYVDEKTCLICDIEFQSPIMAIKHAKMNHLDIINSSTNGTGTSQSKVDLNISDFEEETLESNLPQAPQTASQGPKEKLELNLPQVARTACSNINTLEVNKRKVLLPQAPQTACSNIKTDEVNNRKILLLQAPKTAPNTASETACFDTKTVEVNNRKILIMTCSDCGEKFSSKPKLFEHCSAVHKKNVLFSCENCGFTPLNTQGNLLKGIVNKTVRI